MQVSSSSLVASFGQIQGSIVRVRHLGGLNNKKNRIRPQILDSSKDVCAVDDKCVNKNCSVLPCSDTG